MGANVGATRVNDFSRPADGYGQLGGDHARSRTDPDDAERDAGNYGLDVPCVARPNSAWRVDSIVESGTFNSPRSTRLSVS
jgi:hypothetical protein